MLFPAAMRASKPNQAGGWSTTAQRPTACGDLLGLYWFVTDVRGGTFYQCQKELTGGFTWVQVAAQQGLVDSNTGTSTVSNTGSETDFGETYTVPQSTLLALDEIRVTMRGTWGATATPTLQIRGKLNSATIIDTGAVTVSAVSNQAWVLRSTIKITATGAGGTIDPQADGMLYTSNSTGIPISDPNIATTANDTTAGDVPLVFSAQWSTGSLSNTITLRHWGVELLRGP